MDYSGCLSVDKSCKDSRVLLFRIPSLKNDTKIIIIPPVIYQIKYGHNTLNIPLRSQPK